MSIKDYEGGIITKNPTTPTGPYQDGVASGVWTMDQAAEYTKQGVWPAAGNVNPEQYVDALFSTYLYDGNGSSVTVNNGIDLDGKGGMVWVKNRTSTPSHAIYDTARGPSTGTSSSTNKTLGSNTSSAEGLGGSVAGITSFNSNGFTTASDQISPYNVTGPSSEEYVSWSFLKKPGFFDVVTYTGTGISAMSVAHNLGSTPGCVIIKRLDSAADWQVMFPGLIADGYGGTGRMSLNTTAAYAATGWTSVADSTHITIPTNLAEINASGGSYVAYLFASEDARFGDNQDESIIKCGSFTTDGNAEFYENLGFEPQWVLVKRSDGTGSWNLLDNMRGIFTQNVTAGGKYLRPDNSNAEGSISGNSGEYINATGFGGDGAGVTGSANATFIYIAIRRPMKTPEAGTEVFTPIARTGTGATAEVTGVGFAPDMLLQGRRTAPDWPTSDRLRGAAKNLGTPYTQAETTPSPAYIDSYDMDGVTLGSGNAVNGSGLTYIEYFFKRATGFFDVVAYMGDGVAGRTLNHNLGVKPELIISKRRDTADNWWVGQGFTSTQVDHLLLLQSSNGDAISNDTYPAARYYNEPTSTSYTIAADSSINGSGSTYIAYLFATLAGVSKVGSFTHTSGSDTNVDCGFTSGARFVLIKRTDAADGWQVYDTARGINSGADPVLQLNSTAAEFSQDLMDPYSAGFTITGTKTSGTYIFLAIA
jgi:hypothetical protein